GSFPPRHGSSAGDTVGHVFNVPLYGQVGNVPHRVTRNRGVLNHASVHGTFLGRVGRGCQSGTWRPDPGFSDDARLSSPSCPRGIPPVCHGTSARGLMTFGCRSSRGLVAGRLV